MSSLVSQITSPTIVYSKHQSSALLAFVRGIHRSPVIIPANNCTMQEQNNWGKHVNIRSVGIGNESIKLLHTIITWESESNSMLQSDRAICFVRVRFWKIVWTIAAGNECHQRFYIHLSNTWNVVISPMDSFDNLKKDYYLWKVSNPMKPSICLMSDLKTAVDPLMSRQRYVIVQWHIRNHRRIRLIRFFSEN